MINTAKNKIGYQTKGRRQDWMTDEILSLMDDRRNYKNRADHNGYEHIQGLIKANNKIKMAKNKWLKRECEEIEKLQVLHDDFNLHKKLKKIAGIHRGKNFSLIINEKNEMVRDIQEKKIIWENYIRNLFSEKQNNEEDINNNDLIRPLITKEEIKKAIHASKNNKAAPAGPDEIPSELLKLLDERGIAALHKLFNRIYNMGLYPAQ